MKEKQNYIYYLTQRPLSIGTFPPKPIRISSFDKKTYVEEIHTEAWGYAIYDTPLSEKDIYEYELCKGVIK